MTVLIPPCNAYVLQDLSGQSHIFDRHEPNAYDASDFMRSVLKTQMEPFEWRPRLRRYVPTELGKYLDRLPSFAELYSPHCSFEPQLRLLFEEYRKHSISNLPTAKRTEELKTPHEEFADFVQVLREAAHVKRVRAKQADGESKYKKNASRLLSLEEACFRMCPTVLLIHMPLRLRKGVLPPAEVSGHAAEMRAAATKHLRLFEEAMPLKFDIPPKCCVAYAELQVDRQAFFNNAKGRPSTFHHMIGYAWRTPYAPKAGYHMDAVFMFDGSQVGDPAALRDRIDEYWYEVTEGRGWSCSGKFSSNPLAPGAQYDFINAFDSRKRAELERNLIRPMTHVEHVVAALPAGANIFGTSGLPTRKAHANQQRPRKNRVSEIVLSQWNQGLDPKREFSGEVVVGNRGGMFDGTGAQR
jgi:hypothetical protein